MRFWLPYAYACLYIIISKRFEMHSEPPACYHSGTLCQKQGKGNHQCHPWRISYR